ncbi:ribonuclease H-like domain-containing protein, partial [Tanacetum coccineum]
LICTPTLDLSNFGLEEFQQLEFEGYGPKASKSVCKDTSNEVKKTSDAPLSEKLVSKKDKQTIFPTKIKSAKQQEKPARKLVKYAEMYISQKPRGNQRNWNNLKSQQLGGDFVMYNKACFVCGSFDHVQAHCNYHQREEMEHDSQSSLMKTGLKPLNTARLVNTTHLKTIVYSARPMSFNTAKEKVYTAKPKAVNTARPTSAVVNAVRANQVHPQKEDQGYVDSGCSRHMIGNMSYLTNFKEFDGGYIPQSGGPLVKVGDEAVHKELGDKMERAATTASSLEAEQDNDSLGCDNEIEFKNRVMNEFCEKKGIKREFSVARTPQQNGVAERRNRTLIEAARTMNKKDERGIVTRNKARLVAQGYTQEEGFEDPDYPDKVYKVVKALYGLHQAPRACDYAGASLDRKSTIGGCQFLGCRLIQGQCKKPNYVFPPPSTKAKYVACCCLMLARSSKGRDTKIPQSGGPLVKVGDKVVHKELGDRMERAATTASSLEAK